MLRIAVLVAGILSIAAAVAIFVTAVAPVLLGIYLAVEGTVLTGAILIERSAYRPRLSGGRGRWEKTEERFIDPTSGKSVEVEYNPDTGERRYIE
jgi:uncharacterized protein (DUF58 family)